ncbi:hypothetical protein BXZ70DRAFT_370523 [Cristinia sonorae]|uniref:Uncharacterized protein n=1 Tax=Cristinia sonorae TaxID=1940300 RepID=A0A8K0UJL8_9AGAR|nr:hypothetical protein BXZ70DRAFT_370523 [Cristinia sonorae]
MSYTNHSPALRLVSGSRTSADDDKDFPTSSVRGPSHTHASTSSTSSDPFSRLADLASTASSAPRLDPAFHKCTVSPHREARPGVLGDHRITVNHPLVRTYLDRVRSVPNDRDSTPGDDPFGWKPKTKEDRPVHEVLGFDKPFTPRESDIIFVLAALKVYYTATHRAHFTFWGKAAAEATADRVQKILDLPECPIASPIGWMHKTESIWYLDILQASAFPPSQARRRANGMTLRDRRGGANENVSPPVASRPKRVKTSHAKATATIAATPLRQSARLIPATPHATNPVLPDDVAVATPSTEEVAVPVIPDLESLPALGTLSTPSLTASSLTPSPETQESPALPDDNDETAVANTAPAPARRSSRVPKKRQIFSPNSPVSGSSASLPPTPETTSQPLLVDADADKGKDQPTRPNALGLRARSSSSAQSYESASSTVVSDGNGSANDTAVEMDVDGPEKEKEEKETKKRKRVDDDDEEVEKPAELDDAGEPEPEEEVAVKSKRAARSRKPATKGRQPAKKARASSAARKSVKT